MVLGPELAFLVPLPRKLTQIQVDMLVEAGMPDQLLFIVKENPPLLLLDVPANEQYPRMAKHLIEARRLTLLGMRDIAKLHVRGADLRRGAVCGRVCTARPVTLRFLVGTPDDVPRKVSVNMPS